MNTNEQIIEEFYSAFANHNYQTMASCYHPEAIFNDPAFGTLQGQDIADMWQMLLERAKGNLSIEFSNIKANATTGSAKWTAIYVFSKTNRKVKNKIKANFIFKDGLIFAHEDEFDFHNWAKQALGNIGFWLGWTTFLKKKIQHEAIESLRKFQQKKQLTDI
ncbi:DUF4440 domain-containing protein [Flavobacterium sp. NST-5]|uniref:DUF4440 domain-containing protein n=1 Tax=Flavobacterium ichthyis TaxID=2698827 RepID=A0ABW9ZAF5_9FLAO|nr:nuclear transport factor 2 family protein [Flavobacterium ichthyis]NBL64302.1 DUF4440 domain-containing protein [Flavobacterium ichthyis]